MTDRVASRRVCTARLPGYRLTDSQLRPLFHDRPRDSGDVPLRSEQPARVVRAELVFDEQAAPRVVVIVKMQFHHLRERTEIFSSSGNSPLTLEYGGYQCSYSGVIDILRPLNL